MLLRTSVYPYSISTAVLAIALLAGCSGSGGSGGDPGGGGSGGSGGTGGSTSGGTGLENIGPDGGQVTSRDGRLTLIIPEGALDEPTEITIDAIEERDLGDEFEELSDALDVAMVYELGPDGLEFNEPITARIASELPLVQDDDSLALHLGLMFTSDGDEVALLDNLRVELDEDDTASVSGELDHFSPLLDTVDQLGSSIQFQVFGVPEELEVGESFVAQVTVIAPDEGDGPLQVVAPVSYEDRSSSPIEAAFSPTSAELDETARSVYQGTFEYTCADDGADLYAARMTAGVRITLDSDELVAAETWSNLHQLVECVPAATPAPVNLRLRTFGLGSVVSEPEGIDCDQCEEQIAVFDTGTEITLTATPEQGSEFEGWNGDIESGDDVILLAEECGDNPVCTFTLESDALVDAYFLTPVATLSLGKSGDGEGSVSTEPAGIDCGPTCVDDQEADFDLGTEITLTAVPEDGSVFVTWHPADGSSAEGECGTDPVCTFTLDSDFTYVEAEFQPESATTGETLLTFVAGDGYYTRHVVGMTETGDLEVLSGTIAPYATGVEAFQTSPDGTLVAFSVTPNVDGLDTLLQVVPTDGSAPPATLSQLMAGGRVTDFGWSSNGELWYQARPEADSLDLLLNIVDATGSNHLELVEGGGLPKLSPTGEHLALVRDSNNDGVDELWIIPWAGGNFAQVDADFEDGSFEWTDDGSRLVYREIVGAPIDNTSILRSVLPDGSGLVDLTSGDAMVYEYAVAGNHVVWIDDSNIVSQIPEERLRELYASLADGTGSQKIGVAEAEGGIIGLSRAPDGSKVAYMSRNGASGNPYSLYIVEPDGTGLIPISDDVDNAGLWSPNSETLVFPSGGIFAVPVDASSAPVEVAGIAENLQFSRDSSCLSYTSDAATPGTNELFATKLEDGQPCFGDSTKVLGDVNVTDHTWQGNTLFSVGYDPIAFMGTFLHAHRPEESPLQVGPFSEVHLR